MEKSRTRLIVLAWVVATLPISQQLEAELDGKLNVNMLGSRRHLQGLNVGGGPSPLRLVE